MSLNRGKLARLDLLHDEMNHVHRRSITARDEGRALMVLVEEARNIMSPHAV